ncbi:MAG: FecR family protein [Bacteroidales bacterium]|nr:FecR family protein [Bacteroidales bacterium]
MTRELIEKYLSNNCSDEELNLVLDWFNKSAHLAESKKLLYSVWEDIQKQEPNADEDFDSILGKIHHEINIIQSKKIVEKSGYDLIRYNRRKYIINVIRNIAAILLLPVLGVWIYFNVKYYSSMSEQATANLAYNEVFSSVDAITKITLPDGSNVWLNHNSSLRFPATFQGKSRDVELKGEGYFEVAHNSDVPFVVNAGELKIAALGTKFNVMAYPGENHIETSLIEGIVEIKKPGEGKRDITISKLKPNDLAIYNRENSEIATKTVTDERYFSWKDGKLIFTAEPMEEVVRKLGRWFNVDIIIKDYELNDLLLTATFVNETLPQVMELLSIVLPVNYTITEREKNYDGTFSRRKVILSYRRF